MSKQTFPHRRFVPTVLLPFLCSVTLIACDDAHSEESFENLPDCVVDHASLTEPDAITHCLFDFPELHGGTDFADQQACVDFVTANGGYPNSRDAACLGYFDAINAP